MAVEIVRDVDGVAHVRAPTLALALYGQGFAAATDRLVQMELDRLKATGGLASVLGGAAVASDTFHLRVGLASAAKDDLAALDPEARSALDAYAAGVNARLASVPPDALAPELSRLQHRPAPWEPWHSIAVFKVRHLLMGTFESKVWRTGLVRTLGPERAGRLWPTLSEPAVAPPGEVITIARDLAGDVETFVGALAGLGGGPAGSNNLALAPSRTTTGAPVLAGDPHRALDLPNVYWQNHLTCPEVDAIGLSFPGVPGFPHFGHNDHVAWCITHGMADDQDVYLERLRRDGRDVGVETAAGWAPADVDTEIVEVAGGDPVEVELVRTGHGPVVAGGPDERLGLALRWTATAGPDTTFDALLPMLRAQDVNELDEAMRPWVAPVNNLLTADVGGTIAYRLRGRLAIRPASNRWIAVPGWSGEHEWSGFVDFDDQLHLTDPPGGALVTANQRQEASGPYVSNDFAHPARAARLHQILAGHERWDPREVASALGDTRSLVAPPFVAGLLSVRPRHPLEQAAQQALRGWDHRMDVDSTGAAVYGACRMELLRTIVATLGLDRDRGPTDGGPSLHQTMRFLWSRSASFPEGLTDFDLAGVGGWAGAWATALRWGVRSLESRLGPRPEGWRWGALHVTRFVHPLDAWRPDASDGLPRPPATEVGGDSECVRASGVAPPDLGAVHASVARYLFDLSDWDNSGWIVPHGVSGDPKSWHHTDQLSDWAADPVRLRPMRYSKAAVDGATASVSSVPTPGSL